MTMPALTKVPAIPRAFRWLALQGDAELCEYAAYAGKALSTSARAPKAVVEKAVGRGQAARIVKGLLGVGRSQLLEATPRLNDFVEGEVWAKKDAERELSHLQRLGVAGSRATAAEIFAVAQGIEGRGGDSDVLLGVVDFVSRRFSRAATHWIEASRFATSPRLKAFLLINSIPALVESGAISKALSLSLGCTLDFGEVPSELRAASRINKAMLAVYCHDSNSFRVNIQQLINENFDRPNFIWVAHASRAHLVSLSLYLRGKSENAAAIFEIERAVEQIDAARSSCSRLSS